MTEFIKFFILIGLVFVIYNLICFWRKKIIYTISNPNLCIVDDKYFKLQLIISMLNTIILTFGGILSSLSKNKEMALILVVIIFWIINYFLKWIAISKKMIIDNDSGE